MTQQINRRTVTKGIAWSVPAVALATAAPAFAASPIVTVGDAYNACKLPGASCESKVGVTKGYAMLVDICVEADGPVDFTFSGVQMKLAGGAWTDATIASITVDPDDGRCQTVAIGIQGEPNSQNVSIEIRGTYTWTTEEDSGEVHTGSGTITGSSTDSPPCKNCDPRNTTTTTTEATPAATAGAVTGSAVEEASAEAVVNDASTAEATVVETEEALVEADVQEPVEQTEVVEETN